MILINGECKSYAPAKTDTVASGQGTTTLTLTVGGLTANAHVRDVLIVTLGDSIGSRYTILSNTATTVTIAETTGAAINGDSIEICIDYSKYITDVRISASFNQIPTTSFVISKESGMTYSTLTNAIINFPYTHSSTVYDDTYTIISIDEQQTFFSCNAKKSFIDEQQFNLKPLTFDDGDVQSPTTNPAPTGNNVVISGTTVSTLHTDHDWLDECLMGVIDYENDLEAFEDDEVNEAAALGANSMMRTEQAPTLTPAVSSSSGDHGDTRLYDETYYTMTWYAFNVDSEGYRNAIFKVEHTVESLATASNFVLHLVFSQFVSLGGSVEVYSGSSEANALAKTIPLERLDAGPMQRRPPSTRYDIPIPASDIDTTNDCVYIRFRLYGWGLCGTDLHLEFLRISFSKPDEVHDHKVGRVYYKDADEIFIMECPTLSVYYTTTQTVQLNRGLRRVLQLCGAGGDDAREGVPFDIDGLTRMQVLRKLGGSFMYRHGSLLWYNNFPTQRGWYDGEQTADTNPIPIEDTGWTEETNAGAGAVTAESEVAPDSGGICMAIAIDVLAAVDHDLEYSYPLPSVHTFIIALNTQSWSIVGGGSSLVKVALYDGASQAFQLAFNYTAGSISTIQTTVAGQAAVDTDGTVADNRIDSKWTLWKFVIESDGTVTPYVRVCDGVDGKEFEWTEIAGAVAVNNVSATTFDSVHVVVECDDGDSIAAYIMFMEWIADVSETATAIDVIGMPVRRIQSNKVRTVTVRGAPGYEHTETDTGNRDVVIDLGDVYAQYYCEKRAVEYLEKNSVDYTSWVVQSFDVCALGDYVSFTDFNGDTQTGYITKIECTRGTGWFSDGDERIEYEYTIGEFLPRGSQALFNKLNDISDT